MRIVLIQHGGERVLGGCDTLDPRSVEFHKNALERVGPDELAVIAARWFDESEGQYYWDYRFAPFGPRDRKEGYDVFVCRYEADAAAKMRLPAATERRARRLLLIPRRRVDVTTLLRIVDDSTLKSASAWLDMQPSRPYSVSLRVDVRACRGGKVGHTTRRRR